MNKEDYEFTREIAMLTNDINELQKLYKWTEREKIRVKDYAMFIAVDFLEWAISRKLEFSLGVLVDSEGTYDNMEQYFELYKENKKP